MIDNLHSFYWTKLYDNDLISSHLIKYRNLESYHDNIISEYIKKDSIVLDIGTNIGVFTTKCVSNVNMYIVLNHILKITNYYELLTKNIHINNFLHKNKLTYLLQHIDKNDYLYTYNYIKS